MRRLFLAVAMVVSIVSMAEVIPASDTRVTFVGRTKVEDGSVAFDWTGVYCRVAFAGKYLTMRVSDFKPGSNVTANKHTYISVWVDASMSAEPHRIIEVVGQDTVIELIDRDYLKKSKQKVHQVVIQKRTEGEQGKVVVHQFATSGQFYQAEPLRERQLEFIGASYDCGYGVDAPSRNSSFTPETENASRSFPAIISRYFGADYMVIAHSGMGVVRNYNSKFAGYHMTDRYLQTFDEDSTMANRWDAAASNLHPDMTIIYLGGNDFSLSLQPSYAKFREVYMRLLQQIKDNYGDEHPILCVSSKAHEYLLEYIRSIVNSCEMTNVSYMACCPALHLSTDEDLGSNMHPNYVGHQKMSYAFIPYVATMTGWGLQDAPVK